MTTQITSTQVKTDTLTNSAGTGSPAIKGRVTGTAVAAGDIGEVLEASSTTAFTTSTANLVSISLTPGNWLVSYFGYYGADGTNRHSDINLSAVSGTDGGATFLNGRRSLGHYVTSTGVGTVNLLPVPINVSSTTTYYITGSLSSITGLGTSNHRVQAVRIA